MSETPEVDEVGPADLREHPDQWSILRIDCDSGRDGKPGETFYQAQVYAAGADGEPQGQPLNVLEVRVVDYMANYYGNAFVLPPDFLGQGEGGE